MVADPNSADSFLNHEVLFFPIADAIVPFPLDSWQWTVYSNLTVCVKNFFFQGVDPMADEEWIDLNFWITLLGQTQQRTYRWSAYEI